MQPVTEPVAESAEIPLSPPAPTAQAIPDASVLFMATVQQHFTTLVDLLKSHVEAKKTGLVAEARATAIEGYVARGYSFLMVFLCLGAGLFLSTQKILNGVSAGTLTGTIIGYALSHLRPVTND